MTSEARENLRREIEKSKRILHAMDVLRCQRNAEAFRQALHNRPWWDKALDRIAFLLMDVAAWVSRSVWSRQRFAIRYAVYHDPDPAVMVRYWYEAPDGWRPARYV